MEYTADQKKILSIQTGKHIVHAPAGCGKTEMLTQRVIQALKYGENPSTMICLTFTNRAAIEMTQRLKASTHHTDSQLPFVGNIHKFCNLYLRKNKFLPDSSSLLDEDEYKTILNGIIKKNDKKTVVLRHDLFKYLSDQKRIDLGLSPIYKNYNESFEQHKHIYNAIYTHYEQVKKEFNFYDFDDLLNLTNYHLKNSTENKQEQQFSSFNWLQIDEVQDLNQVQWEIINLINKKALVEVYYGDYEQSIFSFLGSSYDTFLQRYASIENKHSLAQNYRSSADIIFVLNTYLKSTLDSKIIFNSDQKGITNKDNFTIQEIQGTVEDELKHITGLLKSDQYKEESIAVLVRTNKNAELCSNYLNEIGLKHLKVSGVDFFQRKTLKDLFAILNGWSNDFDILAWTRILTRFSKTNNLDDARRVIYGCYKNGLLPKDILSNVSYLTAFHQAVKSGRCIVFDTETTGLDTLTDDIIQIAATEIINGEIGASFNCYIKTTKNIAETYEVHQISEEKLSLEGQKPETALNKFLDFIGNNATLLAHNLAFDKKILNSNLERYTDNSLNHYRFNYFDSLTVSKLIYPKLNSYKLESLLATFNLEGENSHNAIDDVYATVNLVLHLAKNTTQKLKEQRNFVEQNQPLFNEFKTQFTQVESLIYSYLNRNLSVHSLVHELYTKLKGSRIIDEFKADVFIQVIKDEEDNLKNINTHERLSYLTPFITGLKEVDLINSNSKIVISTPHKAKGLGFDHVIIAECNTGVYPGFYSKTEAQILEDKRILYVALSRAKKSILITHHTKFQTAYGSEYNRERSEFLKPLVPLFQLK